MVLVKKMRNDLDMMTSVLVEATGGVNKSRIMYRANLSYGSLEKYLRILLALGLLEKVKEGKHTLYETTDKGHVYLGAYRRLRALVSESEVMEPELKIKTASEKTVKYRISQSDVRFEIAKLKTRIERLERIVPKLEFCPNCRKEIRPDFRLCPYCGEKLSSKKVELEQT